jgi:hypothetical protein
MEIRSTKNDAPEFMNKIQALVSGLLRLDRPNQAFLVKIDSWFGPKWLGFSVGTRLSPSSLRGEVLRLPLFVPNRVVDQRCFAAPNYREVAADKPIHIKGPAQVVHERRVSDVTPGAALIWYSGDSDKTGQGSVLVYLPVSDHYWPWYASWVGNGVWQLVGTKGIAVLDLYRFIETGLDSSMENSEIVIEREKLCQTTLTT